MKGEMQFRILVAFVLAVFSASATANTSATVNFAFKVPAAREDGSKLALTDLATCRLYDVTGTAPVKVADMGLTGAYALEVTSSIDKKYAADCVDTRGIASKLSAAVTVPMAPPNAPTIDVKITYTISTAR